MKNGITNKKIALLFVIAISIGFFIYDPLEISATNGSDLRQVIKLIGTYPSGAITHDVTITPSLVNVSKAMVFMTFSHDSEARQADTVRGWELIDTDTLRIYGHGFSTEFTLFKTITINASEVDEDIALYPHLLDIIDTDLRDDALANGDDIIFTDNTGTTQFPHEIEDYNGTTGALVAWVGVPSVSSSVDTTYRMWYSSPTAGNTQSSGGVWDSDYDAVLHLNDAIIDSTDNRLVVTNAGVTDIAGQIANGEDFDGNNDKIEIKDNEVLDNLSSWTISTWLTRDGSTTADSGIIMKTNNKDPPWTDGYGMAQVGVTDEICAWEVDSNVEEVCFTPADVFDFTYLVATYNGTQITIYSNGTEVATGAVTGTPIANTGKLGIGKGKNGASEYVWNGIMDEVRISGGARSSDYITTTFCDQQGNSICPFDSVGTETVGSFFNTLSTSVDLDFVGYVVEFENAGDMTVQQSNFTLTASEVEGEKFTKLVTPINTTQSFIIHSGNDHDGIDQNVGFEEYSRIRIVNSTDWGWRVFDTPNSGDQHNFAQIIDWDSTNVRVQRGNGSTIDGVNATAQVTPPLLVQRNQTILLISYENDKEENGEPQRDAGFATILDNGDILFNKDSKSGKLTFNWELIEFLDGSVFVQHNATCDLTLLSTTCGTPAIPDLNTAFNITVPITVDLDTSIAISTVESVFGQGNGRNDKGAPRSSWDRSMWTIDLIDGNTVEAKRQDGVGIGVLGIQVITWGNVTSGFVFNEINVNATDVTITVDTSQQFNSTKQNSDVTVNVDTVIAQIVKSLEVTGDITSHAESIQTTITTKPAGGGGGGSGIQGLPSSPVRLIGLNIASNILVVSADDTLPNDFRISWFGDDFTNVKITDIKFEDGFIGFSQWFDFSPFPDLLEVMQETGFEGRLPSDPRSLFNTALDDFVLNVPDNACTGDLVGVTTSNCFNPIIYEVDTEFEFDVKGALFHVKHTIIIDGRDVPSCVVLGFALPQNVCDFIDFLLANWWWIILAFLLLFIIPKMFRKRTFKVAHFVRSRNDNLLGNEDQAKRLKRLKKGR